MVIRDPGSNANQVMGNYLGTTRAGSAALGNGNGGVAVFSGATANTIGGTQAGAGNLVSGNTGDGIFVGYAGTNQNAVQGNAVGVDATAGTPRCRTAERHRVCISARRQISSAAPLRERAILISGEHRPSGVFIGFEGSNNNVVQGNLIGTNASGTAALANGGSGVDLYSGAQSNLVGGTSAGAVNVISGNANTGVFVGYPGTDNNTIQGNLIGLNRAGNYLVPNFAACLNP